MAAPDFSSILDTAPADIERPKPRPAGTYHCVINGQPRYDKSARKQTPFVEFLLKPIAAMEDVDEEELAEVGGFENWNIRATYYLTEDAIWRLKDFLSHAGLDIDAYPSLRAAIDDVPNQEILASVRHRSSEDGTQVFAELARTAPVE